MSTQFVFIPLLPSDLDIEPEIIRLFEDQLSEIRCRMIEKAEDPEGYERALYIARMATLSVWHSYNREDPYYAPPRA